MATVYPASRFLKRGEWVYADQMRRSEDFAPFGRGPGLAATIAGQSRPPVPQAGAAPAPAAQLRRAALWQASYPPELSCAPVARLEAAGALARAGVSGQVLSDAKTVVAELVANAIVHAGTPFTVVVDADRAAVRIDVYDWSPRPPALLVPLGSWPGLGLHIVAAVATAWGWQRRANGPGKVVWAQLQRS